MRNNPIFLLLTTGWQHAAGHRKLLIIFTLMYLGAISCELIEPYIIGLMLNDVQIDLASGLKNADKLLKDLTYYLSLLLANSLVFWILHGPARLIERYVAFQIRSNFKCDLFKQVTNLPVQWQREHHSGENIDKINRASSAIFNFFQDSFELEYMILRLIGTFIILFYLVPMAAFAAIGTTILALANIAIFDRVLNKQYEELNKNDNYVASSIHDYLSNIISVICLRLEKRTLAEVKRRTYLPQSLYNKNCKLNEIKWAITSLLVSIMIVLVMLWYAYSNVSAKSVILAGTFFTLFEYLRRIGNSFYTFAAYYGVVVRQAADLRGVESIKEVFRKLEIRNTDPYLPTNWHEISIQNLNFTYKDEKFRTHHLQDISLQLKKGSSIAFVGESGSGKSTLLNLLRGLQTTAQAEVYVDKHKLTQGLNHLAHTTTLIPQDPELFADTIRFNITFGIETSEEEIMFALRAARFEKVLARLPLGLETNIAEKGVNLSGGEKQRLALARGIFFAKDSDIILLDEPTSSIDTANEREIYKALLNLFNDKCLISSIHRLHLLELFDQIYVLANGQIVESGNFTTLIAKGGTLNRMWKNYQINSESILNLNSTNTVAQEYLTSSN